MRYLLCIDGGGTKTCAYVAATGGGDAKTGRGEAGPGNLTFGLDALLAAARAAVSAALAELGHGGEWPEFEAVWAAFAGCARQSDYERLRPPVEEMFPGAQVRLTGDGELLWAPMAGARCATLICGTGSQAQLWARDPSSSSSSSDAPNRLLRSGGWGPVLDDRGSAFALGKAALCSILTAAANGVALRPWQKNILAEMDTTADGLIRTACSLDEGLGHADADARRKTRIADTSKAVVEAARGGDGEAQRLLRRTAGEVCEVLRPLVDRLAEDGAEAMLVVAGGLGLDDTFWAVVQEAFTERGWRWTRTVRIDEPAKAGLEFLLRTTP